LYLDLLYSLYSGLDPTVEYIPQMWSLLHCILMQQTGVAVCCHVLQSVAVDSVAWHVDATDVCCSALPRVAVCCRVLLWILLHGI